MRKLLREIPCKIRDYGEVILREMKKDFHCSEKETNEKGICNHDCLNHSIICDWLFLHLAGEWIIDIETGGN